MAATLSERRIKVVTRSRDWKMVNSMGDSMNMHVMSTTRLIEMLRVSIRSSTSVGTGTSIIIRMMTTPMASTTSPCLANLA